MLFRRNRSSPKVLFCVEGRTIPATRFRVEQYLPYFREAGLHFHVRYGYGDLYNRMARLPAPAAGLYKAAGRFRKTAWLATAPAYDVVFMQRNALPGTAIPESIVSQAGVPIVFDFDDAVHLPAYDGSGGRNAQTFREMVRLSTELIAGNEYLASRAAAPEKTTVIPTAVDVHRFLPPAQRTRDGVVIGWIGTRPNLVFVESIAPQLFDVLRSFPQARLRLVSNARSAIFEGHDRVEQIAWSEERELELLQSFDIGLMPLFDDEVARGKCGFKMLQYMAVSCPVVASDVGANGPLFEGSDGGTLVEPTDGDWASAISRLVADPELRARQGRSAREHVGRHLSAEKMAARYMEVFRRAAEKR